jgi:hypothetical protein
MGPISIYIPYAVVGERWKVRREVVLLSKHDTLAQAEDAAFAAAEALAAELARPVTITVQAENGSWHPMGTFNPREISETDAMGEPG